MTDNNDRTIPMKNYLSQRSDVFIQGNVRGAVINDVAIH